MSLLAMVAMKAMAVAMVGIEGNAATMAVVALLVLAAVPVLSSLRLSLIPRYRMGCLACALLQTNFELDYGMLVASIFDWWYGMWPMATIGNHWLWRHALKTWSLDFGSLQSEL